MQLDFHKHVLLEAFCPLIFHSDLNTLKEGTSFWKRLRSSQIRGMEDTRLKVENKTPHLVIQGYPINR